MVDKLKLELILHLNLINYIGSMMGGGALILKTN